MAFCKLLLLCVVVSVSLVNVHAVQVNTQSGPVQGYSYQLPGSELNVTLFKGIPYAQPPVGNLRFEKPLTVTPWTETLDATEFGYSCVQTYLPSSQQSEDCLTLNIYVPGNLSSTEDKKAVMIWIHGGGLLYGSGSEYDGAILSALGDVIVVTINYRLNVFGFLNSDGAAPSNVGFWDQHLAIRWVRDSIAVFGGDVSRITIFGESAGSWSVAIQIMSPLNNDTLFQKAICQSGGYLTGPLARKDSEVTALKLAEIAGCHLTTYSAAVTCLKTKSVDQITEKILSNPTNFFLPIKDDEFIVEDPFKLFTDFTLDGADAVTNKVGNLASYDVILGYNSQEGLSDGAHIFPDEGLTAEELRASTENLMITDESLSRVEKNLLANMAIAQYSGNELPASIASRSEDDQRLRMAYDMFGDLLLAWPTLESAILHSAVSSNKKTYLYEFDHMRSISPWVWPEGPEWLRTGADHADEVAFVLGAVFYDGLYLNKSFTQAEKDLSSALIMYWSNFAKTGDPNTQSMSSRGGVTWPELGEGERKYLRFTTTADKIESRPLDGRDDIWRTAVAGTVISDAPSPTAKPVRCTTVVTGAAAAIEPKHVIMFILIALLSSL